MKFYILHQIYPTDIFSEGAPVQDQFIDSVKADDTEMKVSTTLGKRHTANQNPFYKTSMTERLGRSVKNPVFGDYDPNTKLGGFAFPVQRSRHNRRTRRPCLSTNTKI